MQTPLRSSAIAVIGQGYVGLPLAMAAAESGWRVYGIDINEDLVFKLNRGQSHIEDVDEARISRVINFGRYSAHSSFEAVSNVEIVIICVPTPLKEDRSPNLKYLLDSVKSVAPFLKSGTLIINESTSYPGTLTNVLHETLKKNGPVTDLEVLLAAAPERIDPRNLTWGMSNTPRVLAGCCTKATKIALHFYDSICDNVIVVSSPAVAEMAKLLENSFRQVNIALINQLVPVCNVMGIDIYEVIEAAGSKPYGFMKFFPGAGVGGHCIPVDPLYLLWRARELGLDIPLIDGADKTNLEMPRYVADRLIALAKLQSGDRALIFGVSYKSGVSDVRETPAQEVSSYLASRGIEVYWSDPLVDEFENGTRWDPSIRVKAAIIVTAQPGLDIQLFLDEKIPILDCTGKYRNTLGVSQL